LRARFTENLKPGLTYQVVVKTVSGSVASWPATGNVTTRPLPVLDNIQTHMDEDTKEVTIIWEPNPESNQDQYKVGKKHLNLGGRSTILGKPSNSGNAEFVVGRRLLWSPYVKDLVCIFFFPATTSFSL
jgi:receptor-type tyrosine-protein phosphatase beta